MRASFPTVSDQLNCLYACAEIGYEDHATLLEASKLLIILTSYDPAAFTDEEIAYVKTQMNDAEFYAYRFFSNPNPNRNINNEGY
jgi:hypothetical protein